MNATLRVLQFLYENNYTGRHTYHALGLMDLIYSNETIKKWNHARRHKIIIETMTYSFIGKLAKKELILASYEVFGGNAQCMGYYITKKGIEYLQKNIK